MNFIVVVDSLGELGENVLEIFSLESDDKAIPMVESMMRKMDG